MKNGFEQFFQIYWSKGNNPAANELKLFEMAEDHLVQLHVSLAHQYWGYTYTVGWAAMNRAYVEIMDDDTRLKEKLDLQARVAYLEAVLLGEPDASIVTGRPRSILPRSAISRSTASFTAPSPPGGRRRSR